MVRFKSDVRIGIFTAAIAEILRVAAEWSALQNVDVQVNSIADAAPGRVPTSLHPFDLAVDCEPLGNVQQQRQSLAEYFRRRLTEGYDVVFESSHVHVEFDMHRAPLREIAG
jgi:hypothetical protein